jgi:hypothetical protein
MNGWARRMATLCLVVPMLGTGVILAAPAAADDCPLLDPSCITDTVDDVVDEVTDTVDEVTDTVDDVTDDTSDTVDEVVDDTTDTVDDVVDQPGGGTDPGGGGGGGSGGGGGDGSGNGGGGGNDEPGRAARDSALRLATPRLTGLGRSSFVLPDVGLAATTDGDDPGRRFAGLAVAPLATGVALMLLFLALMVGFVSFQHTLDRRDPKLAPDVLASDRVHFE